MKLYDVIEAVNANIKNGALIVHRNMKLHPKFKIYKTFYYDLYYAENKEATLVLSFEETKSVSIEEVDKAWEDCDRAFLSKFMKWIIEGNHKLVLKDGIGV